VEDFIFRGGGGGGELFKEFGIQKYNLITRGFRFLEFKTFLLLLIGFVDG